MAGINQATIVGRVGKDPEIKTFQNGDKVANFSVATSETWRDKNSGERKEKTEWHNIAIKNQGLIGVVESYVRKGGMVGVTGKIETRKWADQSGNDRYTTEIVIGPFRGELTLLGGKAEGQSGDNGGGYSTPAKSAQGSAPSRDLDDEIPF